MATDRIEIAGWQSADSRGTDPGLDLEREVAGTMKPSALDSLENQNMLSQITSWYYEARDLHANNRAEQYVDADYVDNIQYTDEELAILRNRGQPPFVFNITAQLFEWMVGTERRTKVDWNVLGRTSNDDKGAITKRHWLKYISDTDNIEKKRSAQFEDQVRVGVGWIECAVRSDPEMEIIGASYVPWNEVWWDPFSRDEALADCRYTHRDRWIDLDYACAMFPHRIEFLKAAAASPLADNGTIYNDPMDSPSMFLDSTSGPMYRDSVGSGSSSSFAGSAHSRERNRVRVHHTQFRRPVAIKRVISDIDRRDGERIHGAMILPDNAGGFTIPKHLQALVDKRHASLVDTISTRMWHAFWVDGYLLQIGPSPFAHNKFSLIPAWCYRRNRDGMPYGIVRRARDPQDFLNQSMIQAHLASVTKQVIVEEGAVDQANEAEFRESVADPRGFMRVNRGALQNNSVKIVENTALTQTHLGMAQMAQDFAMNVTGVNRENLGQQSNAQSGKAIIARQQEGAVQTAKVFDNFRAAIQSSGQQLLSLTEQYVSEPRIIRITGETGNPEYHEINVPEFNPLTGEWHFLNDITETQADFVVDQRDYRETMRLAMGEAFMQTIVGMDPQVSLALLDIAVELMDLPNKDAIIKRIRALNGQVAPGDEDSPEAKQAKIDQKQAQQRDQQITEAERLAKVRKDEAAATKALADAEKAKVSAKREKVQGQGDAMNVTAALAAAPTLAPGADRLWSTPEQPGVVAPPNAP